MRLLEGFWSLILVAAFIKVVSMIPSGIIFAGFVMTVLVTIIVFATMGLRRI